MLLSLRIELSQLLCEAMLGVRHLLTFAFELLASNHLREVHLEEPRLLAFDLGEDIAQSLSPGLERLG